MCWLRLCVFYLKNKWPKLGWKPWFGTSVFYNTLDILSQQQKNYTDTSFTSCVLLLMLATIMVSLRFPSPRLSSLESIPNNAMLVYSFKVLFSFTWGLERWYSGFKLFPKHQIYVLFRQHLSSIKIPDCAGNVGQCARGLEGSRSTSAQSPALPNRRSFS